MDMLRIMGNDILIDQSELLFRTDFSGGSLERDFEISRGSWRAKAGGVIGYMKEDGGGLIYSHASYPGDILLDFYGRILPPFDNDMNFTFCAKGWDYANGVPFDSYVGGLQGWWIGKSGIEKYPLDSGLIALSTVRDFDVTQEYHIQTGRVGQIVFLYVNGDLVVEMADPNPIADYGRVGLGVYASSVFFRDFKVLRPAVRPFRTSYEEIRTDDRHTKS